MTIQVMQRVTKRIRDAAAREYMRRRTERRERAEVRETDEEIRECLREHDLGNVAFD